MPLYEYQCDACGDRFEVIQRFADRPVEVCPKCGGHVQKLLSSPAIQFKGSGWYITDYARATKSEGAAPADKADATSPPTDAKGDAKSEPKTAGTSEPKTDSKSQAKTGGSTTPPSTS